MSDISTLLESPYKNDILIECVEGINHMTGRAKKLFIKQMIQKYGVSRSTVARYCLEYKIKNKLITIRHETPKKKRKSYYKPTGKPKGPPKMINRPTVRERIIYFGNLYSKYYWRLTGWGLSRELLYKDIDMSIATANRILFREVHAKVLKIKFRREKRRPGTFIYNKDLMEGPYSMLHTSFHPTEWCLDYENIKHVVIWRGINPPSEHCDANYKCEAMKNGKMHHSEEFWKTSHLFRFYPYVVSEEIQCKCGDCVRLKMVIKKRKERELEEKLEQQMRIEAKNDRKAAKNARREEIKRLFELFKTNHAPAIAAANAAYAAARRKREEDKEVSDYFKSLKKYQNEAEDRAFENEMTTADVEFGSEGENEEGDGLMCLGDNSDDYSDSCNDDVRSEDEEGECGENIDGLINDVEEESFGDDIAYWQVKRTHRFINK